MGVSLVGKRINQYSVEELIAVGGMAQVYRARDLELDRRVAIKVIGVDARKEHVFTERLEREARTIAQLRQPNIVGIYHKGIYEDMPYLVIEYVDGPTLADVLHELKQQGQPMEYHAVLTITACVTSALDYAHALGVIHRDIKPSNIMIDQKGHVYLTDFGLALRMAEGTEGKAFGSPYYISPEQVSSSAEASARSDLYSLGVVVYEMLAGRRPFEAKKPIELAVMHVNKFPSPPRKYNPALPPAIDGVLMRVLTKMPAQRYKSGSEFQIALAESLGLPEMGAPIYQPRYLPTAFTSRYARRRSSETYVSATHLLKDGDNSLYESDLTNPLNHDHTDSTHPGDKTP
ncbi:MAG: serine/threonine protein kinase [Anaerolineae bacterium]|nr:serine/threonine protein kinase [Anaerolineae bacterium]